MASSRVPVWLDCDPGHDDALAMLLACYHPGIELLGISTVFGNASIANTTQNASAVLTAIGKKDVPVYQGASKALHRPPLHPPTDIHGVSGLDGTTLLPAPLAPIIRPSPEDVQADAAAKTPAVEAMATALAATEPGTAWVVATGCLTNVAALFLAHSGLAAHVAGVSVMGGAIGGGFTSASLGPALNVTNAQGDNVGKIERIGNCTVWAEWNILADPEAAKLVLEDFAELRGKVTLVPLDLTHQVLATPEARELLLHGPKSVRGASIEGGEENERVWDAAEKEGRVLGTGTGKTTLRTMFVELLMFFAATYKDVFNISSPPLHDPLAVAAVLIGTAHEIPFYDWDTTDPASSPPLPSAERERFHVGVVTEGTHAEAAQMQAAGGPQTGRTVAEKLPAGEKGVRIPRGLDMEMFWRVLEECMVRADAVNAAAGVL